MSPVYEYTCADEHITTQTRSIHADEPKDMKCPECNKPIRQVIGGIAVTFKGNGFYTTDKPLGS